MGCYLLIDGAVSIMSYIGGQWHEIDRRNAGEIFGEVSLLMSRPHRTRAVAAIDCHVLLLNHEVMKQLLGEITAPQKALLHSVVEHVAIASAAHVQEVMREEKLAEVGRMANSIIHDFKNPFQMIGLGAEMIDRMSPSEQIHKICNSITGQVQRMLEMANELGEYSRGFSHLEISCVNLRRFFDSFAQSQAALLGKAGVELGMDVEELEVEMDRSRMLRVFQNLFSNAVEAMGKNGGRIELSARRLDGETVEICVADNGSGIPEQIRGCIWDSFVTAGKRNGIGLGMTIVKGILDAHGASVSFTTETGKGTTFTILLPVSHRQ
ncbi:MAG: cyclic nucleotide-binding domain-containing protein [Opitutales bacterium]|nr:cyclic nucleotide-binding domain-containing protein [Opitutales bacterium]